MTGIQAFWLDMAEIQHEIILKEVLKHLNGKVCLTLFKDYTAYFNMYIFSIGFQLGVDSALKISYLNN